MNSNHALGLPPGSVRAILALLLVTAIIGLALLSIYKNTMPDGGLLTALVGLATLAVKSYFDKPKDREGGNTNDQKQ